MAQLELNFDADLTVQFATFGDVIRAAAYSSGRQFKAIAADLDLSPSMLSRMLNEADTSVNFPAHRIPELIAATHDARPWLWLVATFGQNAEAKKKQAVTQMAAMLPRIEALLNAAGA